MSRPDEFRFEDLEVDRLRAIRQRFLDAGESSHGIGDYWASDLDLLHYDAVFAERIGWKWDAVLDEVDARGGLAVAAARSATVLDWGCGTGIASRRFVERFGARRVLLHDRSARAMAYSGRRLGELEQPPEVERWLDALDAPIDVLLVSHVLTELEGQALTDLIAVAERSTAVVWVESGNRPASRQLSRLRDLLLPHFQVVAPCPHVGPCSALLAGDEQWCHFYAKPPAAVFSDPDWVRLFKQLGIDLRALPYAFFALEKGSVLPGPAADHRLLGRPQIGSRVATVWVCEAAGLAQREVVKSRDKELFRRLKKEVGVREME